jgi:hypothetical protein
MVFKFLVSILAFAVAIRVFRNFVDKNFYSNDEMTKIGTGYLALVFLFLFLLPRSNFALWFSLIAPIFFAAGAAFARVHARARFFRESFCETLSILSMKMKSGRSFRYALAEACAESDLKIRAKLSEIANAVVFSQQLMRSHSNPFIDEVIEELSRIDQNPHSSLKRLAVFRQKLRIEEDFRRRSGQVLARTRAQSLVMSILYVGMFVFMTIKFGWDTNAPTLLLSALLFAVGTVWIYFGGRRIQWKV